MIITLNGHSGTGKSTIAKMLAQELGIKHYSSGDFQRQLAKERGLTIAEWGEKQRNDPQFDRMVDDRMVETARNSGDMIIDGWIAAHFLPESLKIFFKGDLAIRAKRITTVREAESYSDIETAMKMIKEKESVNRKRWIEFYGFDFMDENNYDLVIDTTGFNLEEVYKQVYEFVKSKMK
jgi:CMP/dCMP kinase